MFKIIEGNVTLVDEYGTPLATISGVGGEVILKTDTDVTVEVEDVTVSGVEITNVPLPVEEQNLDSNGYIRNSSHNFGQYNSAWEPFTLTDDGRLRVDIQTSADSHVHNFLDLSDTPTTYSGSGDYYVRVKSTADGLVFDTISGTGAEAGVLPCLQIRRTTNYEFTTGWTDITFDTLDVESDVCPSSSKLVICCSSYL
jgi:hypothetical protein